MSRAVGIRPRLSLHHLVSSQNRVVLHWLVTATLLVGGALLLGQGVYMSAKAKLAQRLIEHSWQQGAAGSPPPTPWWWADTKAVAQLNVPRLNKKLYVMQDDSGESLAFGPGHMNGSAEISSNGHIMIAGHRDSHFEFLRNIKVGDKISTTRFDESKMHYKVNNIYVLDSSKHDLPLYEHSQLSLITCYPFDDFIPGGPLRLVVDATPI